MAACVSRAFSSARIYGAALGEFLEALDLQHRAQVMETTGYEDVEDYSNMRPLDFVNMEAALIRHGISQAEVDKIIDAAMARKAALSAGERAAASRSLADAAAKRAAADRALADAAAERTAAESALAEAALERKRVAKDRTATK